MIAKNLRELALYSVACKLYIRRKAQAAQWLEEVRPMPGEQESTSTIVEPEATTEQQTRRMPPYNVVILNDEVHTFPYVIELLVKLFRHALPKAEELTLRIHLTGRAVVYTTHKELAELKRDQVIAYGPDPRLAASKGPLRCYVEPAEG
jgi:ATP-dependent Clp protease adaptor protein ClpS